MNFSWRRPATNGGRALIVMATLACCAHIAWAQGTTEQPLTNEDVVKLCRLGLGDDVVIAKINQAPQVNFRLDTDSLIALKEQGASKAVIEAMLKRAQAITPPATGQRASTGPSAGGEEGVWLQTSTGTSQMTSVLGDLSATYAAVTYLLFLDFPGLRADLRVSDRRPTLVIRMSKSPRGRLFFVKCERDDDDGVRSVKVGKAGLFGMKSWNSPDKDWTVDYELTESQPGVWQIVPKVDLAPGEYGLLFRGGFSGGLEATQAEMFDFGID